MRGLRGIQRSARRSRSSKKKLRRVDAGARAFVSRERVGDVPISIDPGTPPDAWLTAPPFELAGANASTPAAKPSRRRGMARDTLK